MNASSPQLFKSTKVFANLPCSHRQWRHQGHCAFVHGYSRSFHFVFAANELDECGFVVDFGGLKWVKTWLESMFDHTLLLCADDPLLPQFKAIEGEGGCDIRLLPYGVGMEATARHVFEVVNDYVYQQTAARCLVVSVECRENDKNSCIYYNPFGVR